MYIYSKYFFLIPFLTRILKQYDFCIVFYTSTQSIFLLIEIEADFDQLNHSLLSSLLSAIHLILTNLNYIYISIYGIYNNILQMYIFFFNVCL